MLSVFGLAIVLVAALGTLLASWHRYRPAWVAFGLELNADPATGVPTNVATVTIRNTTVGPLEASMARPVPARPRPAPFAANLRGLRAAA